MIEVGQRRIWVDYEPIDEYDWNTIHRPYTITEKLENGNFWKITFDNGTVNVWGATSIEEDEIEQ